MHNLKKEHITLSLTQIHPYEKNNKIHTDTDVDEVAKSIQKDGYIAPICIDEDNVILCGHGRLLALQKLQIESIEVIKVYGLNEKQKRDYRIRDNTTNLLAQFDLENLKIELSDLGDFSMDIMEHLDFDLGLNFGNEEYNEEIEDEIPNIEHQKIVVQHGDIFQLGNHILMCGDSSNQEDVQKLMNKKQADMIFTDPPYNVNYKGGGKKTGTNRKIENDHMSTQNFQIMLNQWFKRYQEVTKKEAGVYVFHSTSTQIQFQQALEENGFEIKNQLIWNKPSAALGWGDYRWKHEPFFYCTQKDSKTNFYGDRTNATVIPTLENKTEKQLLNILKRAKEAEKEGKTTLWSIKRENVNEYLHPTQKPIELIEYALKNSSKSGDIVLDLFGGSGSTLIAAEKTQRICYMMELDPSFIQVMLQRYHDVTNGSKPIKCMNRDLDFSFLEN